jgi:hypothetical protein
VVHACVDDRLRPGAGPEHVGVDAQVRCGPSDRSIVRLRRTRPVGRFLAAPDGCSRKKRNGMESPDGADRRSWSE